MIVVPHIRYALSAHTTNGAQNCGRANIVSNGWTLHLEQYFQFAGGNGNTISTQLTTTGGCGGTCFSSGTFTVPRNGVYWLSGWGRCERQARRRSFMTKIASSFICQITVR